MKVSSNFDGFEYIFELTAFVKDELKVGTDTVNIPALQSNYPYLARRGSPFIRLRLERPNADIYWSPFHLFQVQNG